MDYTAKQQEKSEVVNVLVADFMHHHMNIQCVVAIHISVGFSTPCERAFHIADYTHHELTPDEAAAKSIKRRVSSKCLAGLYV